jgi:hypothetical protein
VIDSAVWCFEKVMESFTATLRQAQGDNHSAGLRFITLAIITIKLFQILMLDGERAK